MTTRPNPRGDPHSERREYTAHALRLEADLREAWARYFQLVKRIEATLRHAHAVWEEMERARSMPSKPRTRK